MEEASVKRLGLILATQAEIEGMKSANVERCQLNEAQAYVDEDFAEKAEELRSIVHCVLA